MRHGETEDSTVVADLVGRGGVQRHDECTAGEAKASHGLKIVTVLPQHHQHLFKLLVYLHGVGALQIGDLFEPPLRDEQVKSMVWLARGVDCFDEEVGG